MKKRHDAQQKTAGYEEMNCFHLSIKKVSGRRTIFQAQPSPLPVVPCGRASRTVARTGYVLQELKGRAGA